MADLHITGLDALRASLDALPARMLQNTLRVGLRRAANVVKAQAKANFNKAGGPNDITTALSKSIRVTPRRGTPTRVTVSVVAGDLTAAQQNKLGVDSAFYALWVERGHINRKLGEALRGSKQSVKAARAASTSNTLPHPFMKPAIEAKGQEAIDILVETIRSNLAQDAK